MNTLPEDEIVFATGTCFTDAFEIIVQLIADQQRWDWTLVHAIVNPDRRMPGQAVEPIAHAWVETADGKSMFMGIVRGEVAVLCGPTEVHRARLNVIKETRYSPTETRDMNKKHGNLGPWEECYIELTKEGKHESTDRRV